MKTTQLITKASLIAVTLTLLNASQALAAPACTAVDVAIAQRNADRAQKAVDRGFGTGIELLTAQLRATRVSLCAETVTAADGCATAQALLSQLEALSAKGSNPADSAWGESVVWVRQTCAAAKK